MSHSACRPAKRLRVKQCTQTWHLDEVGEGENKGATKEIYLVTSPSPSPKNAVSSDGVSLRAPSSYTREGIRDAILYVCANPMHDAMYLLRFPDSAVRAVPVEVLVVFREFNKESEYGAAHRRHYHVALHLGVASRLMPMKRDLLHKFGLASHWSCEHAHYSSTVTYGIR